MILPGISSDSIALATQAVVDGKLVGLPTETVYGLAGNANDDRAVDAIFAAKGRPRNHPLIVHVAQAQDAASFAASIPDFAQRLMQTFWPGPLTLILPRRAGVAQAAAGGQDSIGVRCPSHPVAQSLLTACARAGVAGLAAPSANRFGRVSPTTAAHVQHELGEELLILDGGPCSVGIESSIVDCTRGAPVLLRPGVLVPTQLEVAMGLTFGAAATTAANRGPTPRASGTLESHYAPQATVRLMDAQALRSALRLLEPALRQAKALRPRVGLYSRTPLKISSPAIRLRRMPSDARQAAQELFAVLREFDAQEIPLVWVETPPEDAQWDGVRDRLTRAATP